MIEDTYEGGALLRRWTISDGRARCLDDAVPVDHPDAAAILAANSLVRDRITAVREYEAAQRLTAGEPPEQWATTCDNAGEPVQVENPAWTAYQAALATIADATPLTLALATVRAGEPERIGPDGQETEAWAAYAAALATIEAAG